MPHRRPSRMLALPVMLVAASTLAACGSSTGSSSASVAWPEASSSVASAAATTEASAPVASTQAQAPYLTTDCALLTPPRPSDTAPAQAEAFGPVSVELGSKGVPIVTVAADAPPAQELEVYDLVPGDGAEAKEGDVITFNYCGIGLTTRQMFDSSWTRNEPLTYGLDELIPGWSIGLPGMKVGGERLLIIPGDLGYGPNPNPASGILADETLIFVVELVDVAQ